MRLVRRLAWRKLGRSAMLAAVSTLGALGMTAGPAAAATLSNGSGTFTATSAINPTAPPPCASYGNYQASLVFQAATVGTYTGSVTFQTNSTPDTYWGENAPGTYLNPLSEGGSGQLATNPFDTRCRPDNPVPTTDAIPQFSGRLSGTNGAQTLNCTYTAATGTYKRGGNRPGPDGIVGTPDDEVGLDITFTGTTNCPGGDTSLTVTTSIALAPTPGGTACNSPIAPQSCVLGPARF